MSIAIDAISTKRPRIRTLNSRQIEVVLRRNNVARVAFMRDNRIEIMPVHYVYAHGAIYGRTALGAKYLEWLVSREVVLEIDEAFSLYDWRSIVVRGSVSLLRARGTEKERAAFSDALEAIRSLIPDAFTERDPTPERRFIFRIALTEITGREASTKP
jgi:nitroimidazol reductase NimA-like FMN-containing flavoprotein (pyridoxamine 5'-phosphate oxidase superfamily)